MLYIHWDPIVFTFMEYIKINHLSQRCDVQRTSHLCDNYFIFMYFHERKHDGIPMCA